MTPGISHQTGDRRSPQSARKSQRKSGSVQSLPYFQMMTWQYTFPTTASRQLVKNRADLREGPACPVLDMRSTSSCRRSLLGR